jgi:hypothetical protein
MEVPLWMPRPTIDNIQVHRSIFSDFAKTQEFELSPDPVKEAILLYLQGLDWLEDQERQRALQQQAMAAEQLGMANAAKPQIPQQPDQNMQGFGGKRPSSNTALHGGRRTAQEP